MCLYSSSKAFLLSWLLILTMSSIHQYDRETAGSFLLRVAFWPSVYMESVFALYVISKKEDGEFVSHVYTMSNDDWQPNIADVSTEQIFNDFNPCYTTSHSRLSQSLTSAVNWIHSDCLEVDDSDGLHVAHIVLNEIDYYEYAQALYQNYRSPFSEILHRSP